VSDDFPAPERVTRWRDDEDYYPESRLRRRSAGSLVGRMLGGFALLLLGGALGFGAVFLVGPDRMGALGLASTERMKPHVEPVTVPADNAIGQQAQAWGVSQCLGGVSYLSGFLTAGMSANWLLTRGSVNADEELFAATIVGQETSSGLRGISNLYAAPVWGGGCNTAYESTIYIEAPCPQARDTVFPTFTTPIDLGSTVVDAFTTERGTGRLFLMPAGPGCVAVKSEIFY
jgi:hypothetical protein